MNPAEDPVDFGVLAGVFTAGVHLYVAFEYLDGVVRWSAVAMGAISLFVVPWAIVQVEK